MVFMFHTKNVHYKNGHFWSIATKLAMVETQLDTLYIDLRKKYKHFVGTK